MNRKMKRIISGALALTLSLSITAIAYAGTSTKSAGNYGTLRGYTSVSGYSLSAYTSVSSNPDSAYLSLSMDAQDISGNSVLDPYYDSSSRGATYLSGYGQLQSSGAYKVFGGHGVQGGSTNPAYAVYTVTSVN
jgi:hypothetical protein